MVEKFDGKLRERESERDRERIPIEIDRCSTKNITVKSNDRKEE